MIYLHSFVFSLFMENTYVLWDDTLEAVIIDPGCHKSTEKQQLQDFITSKNLKVKMLLNTHCHIDHVFGNAFVKQQWNVPALAHRNEDLNLQNMPMAAHMFGVANIEQTSTDQYIEAGEKISFGESELDILFTPGHSPGHLVFVNHIQKFCINGDVLFRMSIGRTDLPGGNYQQLLESIRTQLFVLPDTMQVFTGHGESTTIGFEKLNNPFLI